MSAKPYSSARSAEVNTLPAFCDSPVSAKDALRRGPGRWGFPSSTYRRTPPESGGTYHEHCDGDKSFRTTRSEFARQEVRVENLLDRVGARLGEEVEIDRRLLRGEFSGPRV